MILRQRDRVIGVEDRLHHLGIAGDFLLVARSERADADISQQCLDLSVAEPGALDAGRGPDALDRSDAAQPGKPLRRDPADRPPGALELVDLGDQRQDFGRDTKRRGVECHPVISSVYTRLS